MEDHDAYWVGYMETRDTDPAARDSLVEALQPIIERYQGKAPVCEDRLYAMEAYLLVMNKRYRDVLERTEPRLRTEGELAATNYQMSIRNQRSWSYRSLGETFEATQEHYTAASFSDRLGAWYAGNTLVRAASSARSVGDVYTSQQYLNHAKRILSDSLKGRPDLLPRLGYVLISQSFLYDYLIDLTADPAERGRLAQELESTSAEALALLEEEDWSLEDEGYHARHNLGLRSEAINLYALAAAYQGRHDEARQRVRPALSYAERAGIVLPHAIPIAWLTRSRIAEMGGDVDEARQAALRARTAAQEEGLLDDELSALEQLGLVAEREADWDEAEAFYEAAIELRETTRQRLGLQDWNTVAYEAGQAPYRGLVRTRLAAGDAAGALQILDRTQARYLRGLRDHLRVRATLADDQRAVADSLVDSLEDARLALLRDNPSGSERAQLMRTVAALQEELETMTGTTDGQHDDLDLPRLQDQLRREKRVLLSYFLGDRTSAVFVVRPDTVVAVPLETTPSEIRDHLRAVGSPWQGRKDATDPAFRLAPLHDLYRAVFAPVEPWLTDAEALTVVPDGPLAAVPFATLISERASDYQSAPYLLRRYAITHELASSLVAEGAELGEMPPIDLLAYGKSEFDVQEQPGGRQSDLADLPYVERELRRIARHIQRRQVVQDENATESRFKLELPTAQIVHIASHAEAHPTLPLYTRIFLHDDPETDDDGVLYLYEIQNQSLPANLVVLSGCSTARGSARAGAGTIGLQYAVRAAGASASLATLWPIDDEAVVDLMDAFYEGIEDGLPKDEALRLAQLAYLDTHTGLLASPFYWAAPILSGAPSPVPLHAGVPWGWALAVTVGLLGVGVAWRLYATRRHA